MKVQFLGTGSATPMVKRFPPSQVLSFRQKSFLIDCGEGTQIQIRRNKLSFERIHAIFLSHLHGDHCFGMPGLLSSMSLLGRKRPLHIYAHPSAENMVTQLIQFFIPKIGYKILFHPLDNTLFQCIYEDKGLQVFSIPLKHRVASCGFLFQEKQKELNIRGEMIQQFQIPISAIKDIKQGADFTTSEGKCIANSKLTLAPKALRSYAYCSDTAYLPELHKLLPKGTTLYHEASFKKADQSLADLTQHSTTQEAAQVALAAQAKQLYIGHFSARYTQDEELLLEARETFPNTILAKDNMTVTC